ncbi:MAG: aldo/keto reductase family protein [Phycisphaerales bacterium]|nr:aldo/keto reductase family protein [Phycisphaerales bacterium]
MKSKAIEMSYRPLGRCGTQVSALGLGGWTTFGAAVKDKAVVRRMIQTAFDAGINFFDIADAYAAGEAEKAMGRVLRDLPRHELVISTKLYFPMSNDVNDRGLSRKHVMESAERSLKRIGTDYLDVYFCHRFDDQTPVEETARAMDDLIHQGKVLYWGTSEWTGRQLAEVHALCRRGNLYAPQVEQPQLSIVYRRKYLEDVQPALRELGMGAVVWSPLASGLLTGKYDKGVPKGSRLAGIDWLKEKLFTPENVARSMQVQALADRVGCTRAQLSLAWALAQGGVSSVILGATKPAQLKENLQALAINLPEEIAQEIEKIEPATGSHERGSGAPTSRLG